MIDLSIKKPVLSLIIISKDGSMYLVQLLNDILAQDFDLSKIEYIFIDSMSKDSTPLIFQKFREDHPKLDVRIYSNPKIILASGWNIALEKSNGQIVIRLDDHSRIPNDFIQKNIQDILSGEDICGGEIRTILPNAFFSRLIYFAEISKFGGSPAPFRNSQKSGYVDTLAHAAYRKEVFNSVGKYNENLVRTEDNEIHYRMTKKGYKFYFDSEIYSYRYARNTLTGFIKQKFQNGFWVGYTFVQFPKCFKLRHFLPFFFFIFIIISIINICVFKYSLVILAGISALFIYLVLGIFFSILVTINKKVKGKIVFIFLLPLIYFSIHLSYGLGISIGLIKSIFFHNKIK